MWVLLIVAVVLVLASLWWTKRGNKFICPACGHAMSDHALRGVLGRLGRRSFCKLCNRDCG